MGDCINKQADLMSRDFLGHTNVEILNNNENGASNFPESYWYIRPVPDVSNRFSFSEALNALRGTRNAHRDNAHEHCSNYELNDPLNLLSNEVYNNSNHFSTLGTNSGCFEFGTARQGRYNNIPYILAAIPQLSVNQHLGKSQIPGPPGYYSQIPLLSSETTSFFHGSQRPQFLRSGQPQRNLEYSWFKGKIPITKGNYKPIYTSDSGSARNFGPIGGEMAALRRVRRSYASQGNMIRIFPDNRPAFKNLEKTSNYFLPPKQNEIHTHQFNTDFSINSDEKISFEYKYSLTPNEKERKKNKSTLVTTSVHLGGLLTIPKGIDHVIDNSSQSSSDKSNNIRVVNNLEIFKETTIEGCIEIQKLISQYNIKSPTINIDNFCKSVYKQINNSKNIMQMEPIMREMILGYLYLSSSWISLASVLSVSREQTPSLDNCLESLTKEFLLWQKKSKNLLEQIIISLKKIPLEHEKYVAGIYKSSSSSENSTIFSDDSFSDFEYPRKDLYNHFWPNDFNEYPKQKDIDDTKSIINENCKLREPNHPNIATYKRYGTKYGLNCDQNSCTNNEKHIPCKLMKEGVYDTNTYPSCNERKIRARQMFVGVNSSSTNEGKYSQNTDGLFNSSKGKKNYSSNRPPGKNKYNSSISPRFNGRK
ncbi:uncharacterized protein [Rhodnius prolixus]|uniref:uncharacterized protein n=1 Tax=Rhodnius prolixus TaxID=13249 RepID=UPI003D18FB86